MKKKTWRQVWMDKLEYFILTFSLWMWSRSKMNEFKREQLRKKNPTAFIPPVSPKGKLSWQDARTEAGAMLYIVTLRRVFGEASDGPDPKPVESFEDTLWDTGLSLEERAEIWEKNKATSKS